MSASFVTVATDDITCLGCLVLCNSLKQSGTEKNTSVLVYPTVSQNLRAVLEKSFDHVFLTTNLTAFDDITHNLVGGDASDKLKCWLLTQFTKCVFLESDVLVVDNIDDLFERSELSAVADPRWPDCFDTGLFVFEPSYQTYLSLVEFSSNDNLESKSFECLLNSFFCDWSKVSIEKKIPFIYNCQLNTSFYTHTNSLVFYGKSIKAARLGNSVHQMMQPNTFNNSVYENWNQIWLTWWKTYTEMVQPSLVSKEVNNFNRFCWDSGNMYLKEEQKQDGDSTHKFSENATRACPDSENVFVKDEQKPDSENAFVKDEQKPDSENAFVKDEQKSDSESTNRSCSTEISYHNPNQNLCDNTIIPENKNSSVDREIAFDDIKKEHVEISASCNENPKDDAIVKEVVDTCDRLPVIMSEEEIENHHRQQWERGEIDYMGKDSFENILSKLNAKLNSESSNSNVNKEE